MKKNKLPLPEKGLYEVEVRHVESIEEDTRDCASRKVNVIARTADEAIRKVRLKKGKYFEEYYSGVILISGIDIF